MKKLIFLLTILFTVNSFAQDCSELFISEYVEGWANNKALEIYNPTDQSIDLSDYIVIRYANGSTSAGQQHSVQLNGIIAAYDTYVAVIDKTDPNGIGQNTPVWDSLQLKADGFYCPDYIISSAMHFNGNDAVVLAKGDYTNPSNSQIVDIFGKIGEDPNIGNGYDGWTSDFPHVGNGVVVTTDHSMIRKSNILKGETNYQISHFNPLDQWDSIPPVYYGGNLINGNWSTLGNHDCYCECVNDTSLNITSCEPLVLSNGQIENSSGIYVDTLQNISGCDSIVEIQFNYTPEIDTVNVESCGDYSFNGVNYNSSGSYTQVLTANTGCDSIITINLTVNSIDFNLAFSVNQQLFTAPPFACMFTNETPNISDYNYTWYWGDGSVEQNNNSSVFHEYLNNGTYTVVLIAENIITGCTDTLVKTDYIYTTGGTSCTHSATILQTGPITECSGQNVILSCNSDPNFTYQWLKNGAYIAGNNNDTLIVNQPGSYSVIISENGCPVSSNQVDVSFSSITEPTITSTGTIQPCTGGTVTLSANSGYTSYLWSNGATTENTTINSSGTYTVQVTNSDGCPAVSDPFTVNASVIPTQSICVIGVDSLTNNIRVVWEKPVTTAIDSFFVYQETSVSDVYTKVGSRAYDSLSVWIDSISNPAIQAYRYKVTALDTCGAETPLSDFHKTIHLTINQGVGGAWNLIWSHYEGLTFGSYNIYRGTSPNNMSLLTSIQSNLNSYSDLSPPAGNVYYQIEIINPGNCTPLKSTNYASSKSNIVDNNLNTIHEFRNSSVKVYPNPVNEFLTIESDETLYCNYFIIDPVGRKVVEGALHSKKEIIDISNLSRGMYSLVFENNSLPIMTVVKN